MKIRFFLVLGLLILEAPATHAVTGRGAIREVDRKVWQPVKGEYQKAMEAYYAAEFERLRTERELADAKAVTMRMPERIERLKKELAEARKPLSKAEEDPNLKKNARFFEQKVKEKEDLVKSLESELKAAQEKSQELEALAKEKKQESESKKAAADEKRKQMDEKAELVQDLVRANPKQEIQRGERLLAETKDRKASDAAVAEVEALAARQAGIAYSQKYAESAPSLAAVQTPKPAKKDAQGVPVAVSLAPAAPADATKVVLPLAKFERKGLRIPEAEATPVSQSAGEETIAATDPAVGAQGSEPAKAVEAECSSAIKTYFSEKANPEAVRKFLNLQADLTTQRLAWAYLKQVEGGMQAQTVEDSIKKLLKQKFGPGNSKASEFVGEGKMFRDEEELKKFAAVREEFEKRPLNREALAQLGPYLQEILSSQSKGTESDTLYRIADSDVKLLHILSKTAGASSDKQYPGTVVNLLKLVNSSLRNKKVDKDSAKEARRKLEGSIKWLERRHGEQAQKLANGIAECQSEESRKDLTCSTGKGATLQNLLTDCKGAMEKMYEGLELRSDSKDALAYGKIWARVQLPEKDPYQVGNQEAMASSLQFLFSPQSGSLPEFRVSHCNFKLGYENGKRVVTPLVTDLKQWSAPLNRFIDPTKEALPRFSESDYQKDPKHYQQLLAGKCYQK